MGFQPRPASALLLLWLLVVAAAIALSAAASDSGPLAGDLAITEWVQRTGLPGRTASGILRAATGTEFVLISGFLASALLWFRGYRAQGIYLAAALIALAVLQPLVKDIVDRPRPDPGLIEVRTGFTSPSFPAGHVMSGTVLYGALIYLATILPPLRALTAAIAALCSLVLILSGPANVYMGVHWPSDIVGGWLWALVLLIPLIGALERSDRSARH